MINFERFYNLANRLEHLADRDRACEDLRREAEYIRETMKYVEDLEWDLVMLRNKDAQENFIESIER